MYFSAIAFRFDTDSSSDPIQPDFTFTGEGLKGFRYLLLQRVREEPDFTDYLVEILKIGRLV
jgi:hypothetical protein